MPEYVEVEETQGYTICAGRFPAREGYRVPTTIEGRFTDETKTKWRLSYKQVREIVGYTEIHRFHGIPDLEKPYIVYCEDDECKVNRNIYVLKEFWKYYITGEEEDIRFFIKHYNIMRPRLR